MIKHIFCDLDGTLLKDFRRIDSEDIKALQEAQARGITISIATGRLDYEIKKIMERYNFRGFRISQNGAVVVSENDNLIYEKSLAYEDVLLILEALKSEPVIIFFQTIDHYYIEKKLPIITEFEKSQDLITYIENPYIICELPNHKIITISTWQEKNTNIEVKKRLDARLPMHIESYISSKYTMDITSKDNSKGNAIRVISQKYNLNLDEIAVIGDSQNDLSMFELINNSYVMANSDYIVKSAAKWEVKSVKEAVEHILANR
ncbi:MAG: HAD family hydrolase [Bacilli bacterium]|nr:HAD family hydrolase [Bacilli bacterium]